MPLKGKLITSVVVVLVLVAAGIYGFRSRRNYEFAPLSSNYSGTWVVYSRASGEINLVTPYQRGLKQGTEISWYRFPDRTNTVQSYSNGVLHGISTRYNGSDDNRPLLTGRFVAGKPWEGTFLVWANNELLTDAFYSIGSLPDVVESACQYSNGVAVIYGTVGPQGFEPPKH